MDEQKQKLNKLKTHLEKSAISPNLPIADALENIDSTLKDLVNLFRVLKSLLSKERMELMEKTQLFQVQREPKEILARMDIHPKKEKIILTEKTARMEMTEKTLW